MFVQICRQIRDTSKTVLLIIRIYDKHFPYSEIQHVRIVALYLHSGAVVVERKIFKTFKMILCFILKFLIPLFISMLCTRFGGI